MPQTTFSRRSRRLWKKAAWSPATATWISSTEPTPAGVVRRWRTKKPYRPELFRRGWMPPHPAFFACKAVYDAHGLFDLDFPLAADYELMLRFLYFRRVGSVHIPRVLVKMRRGGTTRLGPVNTAKMIAENRRSWFKNGEKPRPLSMLLKRISKIRQFF